MNTNVRCSNPAGHSYAAGKALVNLATNGHTTNSDHWKNGEGIYPSKKARTVDVRKCIHCGASQ